MVRFFLNNHHSTDYGVEEMGKKGVKFGILDRVGSCAKMVYLKWVDGGGVVVL